MKPFWSRHWWSVVLVAMAEMLALAGIVFSVRLVVVDFGLRRESIESASWPSVPGTVTDSRLEVHQDTVGPRGGAQSSETFEPRVAYIYTVDDHPYIGTRVQLTSEYDEQSARNLVAHYRLGDNVLVSYRPGNPSHAVLEPYSWSGWWVVCKHLAWCAISAFMALVTAVVVASFWREFRKARAPKRTLSHS